MCFTPQVEHSYEVALSRDVEEDKLKKDVILGQNSARENLSIFKNHFIREPITFDDFIISTTVEEPLKTANIPIKAPMHITLILKGKGN